MKANSFKRMSIHNPNRLSIVIIISLLCLSGCEDIYHNIPDENLPVFKTGDRFIYSGSGGKADTLEVEIQKYYLVSGDEQQNHYQVLSVAYHMVKNGLKDALLIGISQGAGLQGHPIHQNEDLELIEMLDAFPVKNTEFHYVYHFQVDDSTEGVTDFYYQYRFGLLQYRYGGGEVMELN
jgi:hypothetical protein